MKKDRLPQDKDPHLDIPSEANQDKHINFLDVEDGTDQNEGAGRKDTETEERQRQWREGLEEGKRSNREE